MKAKMTFAALAAALLTLSACANTIRGVGQDTANAVDATQSAGQNVENAAAPPPAHRPAYHKRK